MNLHRCFLKTPGAPSLTAAYETGASPVPAWIWPAKFPQRKTLGQVRIDQSQSSNEAQAHNRRALPQRTATVMRWGDVDFMLQRLEPHHERRGTSPPCPGGLGIRSPRRRHAKHGNALCA